MRTKNELYQEALRTVAARRQMARARAQDARTEAEAAIPALRHAEEEVRVRGIRCAMAGAAGKDRTAAAAALKEAKQQLTALLAASGRPADALEPKFRCKLCQDTGSVEGRTCQCVRRVMQKLRREEIEALSSLSISSFDTMELRYYPNRMDEKLGEPVRSYMGTLLEDLKDYAQEFDHSSESLMLLGNAGLGKTHAALAIAGMVLEKGYDVIYVSSPDFFGRLEALHFGTDPADEEETMLQTAAGYAKLSTIKTNYVFDKKDIEIQKEIFQSILFRNLERERAEKTIRSLNGKLRQYTKNEMIIQEEQVLHEIGILISGELCKVQYYPDGTEQMVQKLLPSYVVGLEIAISQKKTSPYSVYAVEEASIFWFPVKYLEQEGYLPESDRIFLYQQTVQFLANEDIRKYRKIEILSAKSARGRIEKYLKIQMIRYKSNEFDIDFNREQMASYLGLNRSVLSHELKMMEKEGILTVRKNHFVIHEKEK